MPIINNNELIHMDAMLFGMGSCCVQTTYQMKYLNDAC